MTYFLESTELINYINRILSKEKMTTNLSKIFTTIFDVVGLSIAVYVSVCDGYGYQVGIFIMCMVLLLNFPMLIIPRTGLNTYRQRKRTITLNKDDIQLKNWKNELECSVLYEMIQYVEVVPLLGLTYFHPHGGCAGFKKMYFICLHISRCKVKEGDYRCNYISNKNVIIFPYETSAWDILSRYISDEKIKPLEDITPIECVKWHY